MTEQLPNYETLIEAVYQAGGTDKCDPETMTKLVQPALEAAGKTLAELNTAVGKRLRADLHRRHGMPVR